MATPYYFSSLSMGKDSVCQTLMLIEKGYRWTRRYFSIRAWSSKRCMTPGIRYYPYCILQANGIKYTELHPEIPFLYSMLERPVRKRGTDIIHKYGYS